MRRSEQMTFEERFDFNNPTTIEIATKKINASQIQKAFTSMGVNVQSSMVEDCIKIQTEYLAIRKIYNSIIGSPLVLNANWVSETYTRESYFNQAQYICEIIQNLKTDFIVCGCTVSAYIKLSQNFKRADSDHKGVYKTGTFDNGIETYKAPPDVLPTDEFIYYDNALSVFKKGKIINCL